MKTEEVIELARMAGAHDDGHRFEFHQRQYLEAFATEVERRTLERAAVVCEGMRDFSGHSSKRPWPGDYAAAIRALKEPT